MNWYLSHAADPRAARLANRHYSRQKPGTPQFSPPGRKLILLDEEASAVWASSWPFPEFVRREYADAWCCSLFRNESTILSSTLICEAVAITRWKYGTPPTSGMVTMIDASKVKSRNPGYCYKCAGFVQVGFTKGGLVILQLRPEDMPPAQEPATRTMKLWEEAS